MNDQIQIVDQLDKQKDEFGVSAQLQANSIKMSCSKPPISLNNLQRKQINCDSKRQSPTNGKQQKSIKIKKIYKCAHRY